MGKATDVLLRCVYLAGPFVAAALLWGELGPVLTLVAVAICLFQLGLAVFEPSGSAAREGERADTRPRWWRSDARWWPDAPPQGPEGDPEGEPKDDGRRPAG